MKKISIRFLLFLGLVITTFSASASYHLLMSVVVIRHGDRTPIKAIINDPYPWQPGLGKLTGEGIQQEYSLGKSLRKKYIIKDHLLPSKYDLSKIYVRSTDYDRTLMSAESLLYGLYPLGTGPEQGTPKRYQPIPIHTVAINDDKLLATDNKQHMHKLFKQYVFNSKYWQDLEAQVAPYYTKWQTATGLPIKNLLHLITLADNLNVRALHHIPLPSGITAEDAKLILSTSKQAFPFLFNPHPVGKAYSMQIINAIKQHFDKAKAYKQPLKFVLYSAHDSTLMGLLSALRVPTSKIPHYASLIAFDLYQEDSQKLMVRVSYNGKSQYLPGCHYKVCTLAQFDAIL